MNEEPEETFIQQHQNQSLMQEKITPALVKAQLEIGAVIYNKINPHFRSKYADLAAIRDAIKDPLAKNGLVVVQTTKMIDAALYLSTKLQHVSGQFIESIYPIKIGTPQQMGSELTYARRYGISAMLNLAAEDDDDANAAEDTTKPLVKPTALPRTTNASTLAQAETIASQGVSALQGYWESLDGATQKKLEPHKVQLKAMAAEADAERAHIKGDFRNAG